MDLLGRGRPPDGTCADLPPVRGRRAAGCRSCGAPACRRTGRQDLLVVGRAHAAIRIVVLAERRRTYSEKAKVLSSKILMKTYKYFSRHVQFDGAEVGEPSRCWRKRSALGRRTGQGVTFL